MTIPTAAVGTPISKVNAFVPIVTPEGTLTPHGQQLLTQWHDFVVGMGRVIPCSASGTNVITLTPNDASPLIEKYVFGDIFVFTAAASSSGVVTGTVVPKTGALATLKVYATDGAAQATTGDIIANSVYMWLYAPHLDTNVGGFVLK